MVSISKKSNLPAVVAGDPPKIAAPFAEYKANWQAMEKLAQKYNFINKIILIGHGGSVNTFRGIYQAFHQFGTPELIIIDTNESDYIHSVLERADKSKTLILGISKSGESTSQIESVLAFLSFPHKVFITKSSGSVLKVIVDAENSIGFLEHPEISGRFVGFTEAALFPALLCGFNAHGLVRILDSKEQVNQMAWELAVSLWELEQQGVTELLVADYTHRLNDFGLFIQQLLHETLGKKGLGLTVVPVSGPEFHHHTTQRLFDGHKNMSVVFVLSHYQDLILSVPKNIFFANLRGKKLGDFDGLNLTKSLMAEYKGIEERLEELGIPNLTLNIGPVSAESVGEYILFWQMVAFYGAHLRGLNPFDQPAVEASKDIAFRERFG